MFDRSGNRKRSQSITVIERVGTDCMQIASALEFHLLQIVSDSKGRMSDVLNRFREIYGSITHVNAPQILSELSGIKSVFQNRLQIGYPLGRTAREGVHADFLDPVRNRQILQALTQVERIVADSDQTFRHLDIGKIETALEHSLAKLCERGLRQVGMLERSAVQESTVTDRLHRGRKLDTLKSSEIVESMRSDRLKRASLLKFDLRKQQAHIIKAVIAKVTVGLGDYELGDKGLFPYLIE